MSVVTTDPPARVGDRWRLWAQQRADSQPKPPLWWRGLATLLSGLYTALVALRRGAYQLQLLPSRRLPGLTLAVGNLASGGTGKSPVTMRLAELLLAAGHRPAILTRGYGSDLAAKDQLALLAGQLLMAPKEPSAGRLLPDEGRMQSALLPSVPVIAGRSRWAAAQRFLAEHPHLQPTHWLLDDGFQHWQLQRDADIVLLDAAQPIPRRLPRGIGREGLSALRRAKLILLTRSTPAAPTSGELTTLQQSTAAVIAKTTMRTAMPRYATCGLIPFTVQQHTPLCLVSGVAQPAALYAAVTGELNLPVAAELRLADHGRISREQLQKTAVSCQAIATTAKDYWRDPAVFAGLPQPVFILELRLSGADLPLAALIKRLP